MYGNRIRELRKEKGFSLQKLATLTGVSRQLISSIELEKSELTTALIYKFCYIFYCTSDYLLGISEFRYSLEDKLCKEKIKNLIGDINVI